MDGKTGVIALMRGIDRADVDGAVAELQLNDDGTITADIRIPGHQRDGYD